MGKIDLNALRQLLVNGCSQSEAARILQVSPGSVSKAMRRRKNGEVANYHDRRSTDIIRELNEDIQRQLKLQIEILKARDDAENKENFALGILAAVAKEAPETRRRIIDRIYEERVTTTSGDASLSEENRKMLAELSPDLKEGKGAQDS
jgi:predicted transcriptional regulator